METFARARGIPFACLESPRGFWVFLGTPGEPFGDYSRALAYLARGGPVKTPPVPRLEGSDFWSEVCDKGDRIICRRGAHSEPGGRW